MYSWRGSEAHSFKVEAEFVDVGRGPLTSMGDLTFEFDNQPDVGCFDPSADGGVACSGNGLCYLVMPPPSLFLSLFSGMRAGLHILMYAQLCCFARGNVPAITALLGCIVKTRPAGQGETATNAIP